MPQLRTPSVLLLSLTLAAGLGAQSTFGAGTAGSGGVVPRAWFTGSPSPGSSFSLDLDRAVGGAPAFAVLGFVPGSTAAAGIVVHVQPLLSVFVGPTSGAPGAAGVGTASMGVSVPSSASFIGLPILSQWVVADAGSVTGLSASDALRLRVGPTPLVIACGTAGSADRVYALDPATGTAPDWNSAVGANNPAGVEFTPDGTLFVVAAELSHRFIIADATNNGASLASVSVGSAIPNSVAITPDGRRAYGITGGPQSSGLGKIIEIDLDPASATFGTQIGLVTGVPFLSQLEGVGISGDGKVLAAVNLGLGQTPQIMFVDIDAASAGFNTVVQTGILPGYTTDVRLSYDGALAYVAKAPLGGPGSMFVVLQATGYIINTVAGLGDFPTDLEISPREDFVLLACPNSNEVVRIDIDPQSPGLWTHTSVTVPGQPFAVTIAADGRTGWCTEQSGSDVHEFDTASMTILRTFTVGTGGAAAISVR